jgi:uncharacterized phage-associated protein
MTVSVHDVTAYILFKTEQITTMKLQKLVYYSQAWHLVWAGDRLFSEPIQAWANGPVVYELFQSHRGQFTVAPPWARGDVSRLSEDEISTIDAVLDSYGHLEGFQLSILTHEEAPWLETRGDLGKTVGSNREISLDLMQQFYSGLQSDDNARPIEDLDWNNAD